MGQINKNRLHAHKNMGFCASLMTACNVAYLCSSMLFVQICLTRVKQLQCSLATHSLCTVHNWLDAATLAILYSNWHVQIQHFLAVECTKLVQNLISVWSKQVSNNTLRIFALKLLGILNRVDPSVQVVRTTFSNIWKDCSYLSVTCTD